MQVFILQGYSGAPLIMSPLRNGKSVLVREITSCGGYIKYNYVQFGSYHCGLIREVASGEGGHIYIGTTKFYSERVLQRST